MAEPLQAAESSEEFVRELTDHQTAMLAYIRSLAPGSPNARDLLHHRCATDGSLEEFAAATNRAPGTLKAILFNLRAALRKCIHRQLQQAGHPAR